jgi:hypothetical protein
MAAVKLAVERDYHIDSKAAVIAGFGADQGFIASLAKTYPSDVSDEEWALVAPYLSLLPEDAGRQEHSLRERFNGLRDIIKTGAPWRWMPNDLPP